jgi:hypothetical protein
LQYTSENIEKYWKQMLATYVYNHCNIHLKHLKHTLTTCVFQPSSVRHRAELETAGSNQSTTEDGGAAWQSLPRLCLAWARPMTTPSPGRLGTQGGTGERPEPSGGEKARRLVGGGRGKRATPMEAPVASRQCGCVVQKAVRQSGEVVKASNILEAIKVVQQAC